MSVEANIRVVEDAYRQMITEVKDGSASISLQKEVDLYNTPAIREIVESEIRHPETDEVVLDLRQTQHIDSAGLGAMVDFLKLSRVEEKALRIVNAQPKIEKIFEMTGLDVVFDITPASQDPQSPA